MKKLIAIFVVLSLVSCYKTFSNKQNFDKIEMNISEVEGYINGEEQTDAVSHCRVLGFLFEHLPKNYKFKLENIL